MRKIRTKVDSKGRRVVASAQCAPCSCRQRKVVMHPASHFHLGGGSAGLDARCKESKIQERRTRDGRIRRMLADAKWNAATAGRRCTLTYEDIDRVFGARCAVTGLPFDMGDQRTGGRLHNMNLPSLDRINSKRDYTPGNIQVVLLWVNAAKGRNTQKGFVARLRTGEVSLRHVNGWQRRRRRGGIIRI